MQRERQTQDTGIVCPTWIFRAISLPSFKTPWCTWPMEAAANGLSSKDNNFSLQLGPRSPSRTFYKHTHTHTYTKSTIWSSATIRKVYINNFNLTEQNYHHSWLHSSARRAWSLHSAEPFQRSSAIGGWWTNCLREEKILCVVRWTFSLPRHDLYIPIATVHTLYTEHLSDLECSSTDLTECVDYSLSIGLWQEWRVQQGIHVYETHKHIQEDHYYEV